MKRREFIKNTGVLLAASPFMNFSAEPPAGKKMIVLGIDGMDPKIVYQLINKGLLPNFRRLAEKGSFTMMRSTIPPHSPVAWGSFISGADPGKYGIFDFLHRDPKTYLPEFAMTETIPSKWIVNIGKYRIPLKGGKVILRREGRPFWDFLADRDIEATIFQIPTNYPPSDTTQRTVSGLGTPDILGGYGVYTLFTSDESESLKDLSSNNVYYAYINENNVMENGVIEGPVNDLVENGESVEVPFRVYVDFKHKTARIDIQGKEILVAEKQISEWVEIEFPLIKNISSVTGMVKFYLMETGKKFRLYVSPIHISPMNPALPISTPESYSREVAEAVGLFHTKTLPADTKALSQGTFSMENYIVQHLDVFEESRKLFSYEFERFLAKQKGFLFFYFSSLDQGQHMFWALNDKNHPFYHPEESKKFGFITRELYQKVDKILGEVLDKISGDTAVMVVSDHGFNSYRRKFNINNWLFDQGYLQLDTPEVAEGMSLLEYADWSRTKVYGFGFNGLYLNLAGREAEGIVKESDRRKFLEELKTKLEMIKDPKTGDRVISTAYISEDNFSKDFLNRAPDIILGFNKGYRAGDSVALGDFSKDIFGDNLDWWSGDHLIDPKNVPASFFSNFKINKSVPEIKDMAPTILKFFGITNPQNMNGESII